jgi:hypothetical protein
LDETTWLLSVIAAVFIVAGLVLIWRNRGTL